MRKITFIGSWKTYKTTKKEIHDFFDALPGVAQSFDPDHEILVAPSTIHIEEASTLVPKYMKLCGQDCSAYGKGPHTGETTAEQLSAFGVKYCIVGHAERRQAGETDEIINKKIKQCLAHGITPIVCVGETLQEYDNDQTRIIIERQMRDSLFGIKNIEDLIICYMPIWTIGTGFYATGEYGNIIADFMRRTAVKLTGNPMSANFTLIFGGQITSSNIVEYLECPEIDGAMFAIAALQPKDFAEIVKVDFSTKAMLKIDHTPPTPPKK